MSAEPDASERGSPGEESAPARGYPDGVGLRRGLSLLASVVRFVTALFALILVAFVVFVVVEANPDNWLFALVGDWAGGLTLGLADLFAPDDPRLRLVINYGAAAVAWLVIGAIVGRLLRRAPR